MSSTPTSEDSTKVDSDISAFSDDHKGLRPRIKSCARYDAISRDIFLFLVAFRIVNALSIRTFFQPDEYFQSLEPAWEIAFGADSGAWITWEWKHYLRSAIHPFLFAVIYKVSAAISAVLDLSPAYRADILITSPKLLQASIAAVGDYYTWKLGQKVYGERSNEAWATLALTICNPWQWFCSTRTLSNCLETTLTIIALSFWPWHWSIDTGPSQDVSIREQAPELNEDSSMQTEQMPKSAVTPGSLDQVYLKSSELRQCLVLAALACVLRPTNVLVWASLACFSLFRIATCESLVSFGWANAPIWVRVSSLPMFRVNRHERVILIRETALCGSVVLTISALLDRLYYGQWVFPPLRFLYFNIAQSLAVIYGRNDWHYYMSQGFPLLLTTILPFTIIDMFHAIKGAPRTFEGPGGFLRAATRYQLASIALLVPFILSFISHKEVRFIYPLLPLLHLLSAQSFTTFFLPAISPASPVRYTRASLLKRLLLGALMLINIAIAIFTTQLHQPAPLSVLSYLRHEHEQHYLTQPPLSSHIALADTSMTVGFLMPCHSTPWRSHLVHPGIKAWALSCEPPVNFNASARAAYRDEADQFYDNPGQFLSIHLGPAPRTKSRFGGKAPQEGLGLGRLRSYEEGAWDGKVGKKFWPDYLVFFGALEATLKALAGESGYVECWRGWNSWVHDDWRRKGDVIVWCLRGREAARKGGG